MIATITQDGDTFAREVADVLRRGGLRCGLDLSNEKIGYKVREHSLAKVPLIIAIGKKEAEDRSVSIRRRGAKGQESIALEAAVDRLVNEARAPGS